VIFFFCDSDVDLRWIGSCTNILKMPYSPCLLSQKVANETVRTFASSDMVALLYTIKTAQINENNLFCSSWVKWEGNSSNLHGLGKTLTRADHGVFQHWGWHTDYLVTPRTTLKSEFWYGGLLLALYNYNGWKVKQSFHSCLLFYGRRRICAWFGDKFARVLKITWWQSKGISKLRPA